MQCSIHSFKRLYCILAVSISALLTGCGGGGGSSGGNTHVDPPSSDATYLSAPGTTRTWLAADDLVSAKPAPASPLHNGYFMPISASASAPESFSGTIHLTSFTLNTDDVDPGNDYVDTVFPNADLQFASDGSDLIPVDRDILVGTNASSSRLILGPGMIWKEDSDNGWSRASFPFEIVVGTWNMARNGLATFVYKGSQISALRVQMVQETVGGGMLQSNIWGTLQASYTPEIFADNNTLIADFRQEKAGYLPVSPWSELSPQLSEGAFNGGIASNQISMTGVVSGGVIYRQPCRTRFGDYPYCQQMRSGAFSATKSMGAAVAFLRLAKKYGDGVANLLIKDYVNVTATHNGWDNVTFLDALDMATGIGDANPDAPVGTGLYTFGDENSQLMSDMFSTPGEANMLALAFTQGKYSWGPGVETRYNSMHTFILSAAMDAYLKQQEGPNAHLWDMVVNEVYKPIGIAHAPMMHTIESDGSRGIPFMDVGLYPTADDAAKIATLFQNGGSFNGQQLLSANLTATALYRTTNQGLRGSAVYDNGFGESRYLMSFWSLPWSDGAGCDVRIPYMNGAGGNLVALLPNGVSVFRFTHANIYDPTPMIIGGAKLGDMCP